MTKPGERIITKETLLAEPSTKRDTTMQPCHRTLETLAAGFDSPDRHLRELLKDPDRMAGYAIQSDDLFFDFSRQRLNREVKAALTELARETKARDRFCQMTRGEIVNETENRAALHTASRHVSDVLPAPDDPGILKEILRVRREIQEFTHSVYSGGVKGTTGQSFTDAVVVGIGGSYLGCEFVYEALKTGHHPRIRLHFLPNVDIDNFGRVQEEIRGDTCLWIVISKSYTTTETMANLAQVLAFLKRQGLAPEDHLVTVTAKGSPGDDPGNPVLAAFHMFDFIGGRYSVTSAVGGVPLSLAFGVDLFDRFLQGCHRMDCHAATARTEENIPLTAALISIWNTRYLGYGAQAIIPYSSGLFKLAPHVQQLYMESLGKGVTRDGRILARPSGSIIFGEPGTNAQHSFFQLAHQGPAFPVEFIGILRPAYQGDQARSKGVTNHQELWANLVAQAQALALGKDGAEPARSFPGNRPSSLLVMPDLSPERIGVLLSFYEARTVFEGFILNVNPFDQFGVELGKVLATDIRKEIAARNGDPDHEFAGVDPGTAFYLEALFKGEI